IQWWIFVAFFNFLLSTRLAGRTFYSFELYLSVVFVYYPRFSELSVQHCSMV
ncbi:hypothetical protein BKA69DRAFT_1084367, partial [Paraphysoderma sedebokerense]